MLSFEMNIKSKYFSYSRPTARVYGLLEDDGRVNEALGYSSQTDATLAGLFVILAGKIFDVWQQLE